MGKCKNWLAEKSKKLKEKDTCGHCCCRFKTIELPDWCKVGEWYYDAVLEEYDCVKKEKDVNWYIDNIEGGRVKQARKRPFNADEMKALVGKVIENDKVALLVEASDKDTANIGTYCGIYNAKALMDNGFVIDGKPCYVLEHLENWEWVK